MPDLLWSVTATVPHDAGWSKNRMWLARAVTHARRLNPLARDRRDHLATLLARQIDGRRIRRNRLWLSIHVAKTDHRSDALNVIDLVADAVEIATGLNDLWYSLAFLTWSVDPDNPTIEVTIGQEDVEDVIVCSSCGLLLPPRQFQDSPIDQGVCRLCRSKKRRRRSPVAPPCPEADHQAGDAPPW